MPAQQERIRDPNRLLYEHATSRVNQTIPNCFQIEHRWGRSLKTLLLTRLLIWLNALLLVQGSGVGVFSKKAEGLNPLSAQIGAWLMTSNPDYGLRSKRFGPASEEMTLSANTICRKISGISNRAESRYFSESETGA